MTENKETPDASSPDDNPAGPPPAREIGHLGQFELLEKIGEGGMGAVYRGIQTSLHRPVAIKLLPESLAKDQSFVERFHREARAAAALNHPNIIQVYDAGEQDGIHYFAMELVDGETLSNKVERDGPMHEPEAIAVAMCVAAALHHAWTKAKLIHRDIKPDNLIVTSDGMVKVCDLGLAKSVGQDSNLTVSGTLMGTPHFIAPEQACGEAEVDTRADIYSLGASLFFLVTGKPPFHADSSMAVMYKHVNEPLPDPRKINPKLSSGLVRILKKMTAKDPKERYPDMLELYNDLERVYQGLAPMGQVRTPESPEVKLRRMRRWLRLWIVLGIIGLCALAVIGVGMWKTQQQRHPTGKPHPAPAKTNTVARTGTAVTPPSGVAPVVVTPTALSRALAGKHQASVRERVQELLKQQQNEATHRSEEQRKADEEAERQRVAARAVSEARLAAERAYPGFLDLWKPLMVAHNYAKAGDVAQNAIHSAVYAPIKERLELHVALGDALKALDDKFQRALPSLKGQPLTLSGFSGTVGPVDATSVTIETRPGVGRTFTLAALRIEDRLGLILKALGPNDPEALVNAGLVSIVEGQPEWTRTYFQKVELLDSKGDAKAVANRFKPLLEAVERAPLETAAAAALDEAQSLVTAAKWQEANTRIAVASKQFAETAVMKYSAERIQDMKETLIAAEAGPQELRAQLTLNQLQQDVEAKNWAHAAKTLRKLDQQFARTETVKNSRELAVWRGLVDTHASTGDTGTLPGPTLRQQLASRPGVTIHQVSNRAKGKLNALTDVLAKAGDGDGIELDEGFYSWHGTPATLKDISIFAKPGAAPVLIVASYRGDDYGLRLTETNGCWRFEGVVFDAISGYGAGMDKNTIVPSPIVLGRRASAEFNQCAILWRRVDQMIASMIHCEPGSELVLRNCVLATGRGIELSGARSVRFDHCTCIGGSLFWLSAPRQTAKVCEVQLANSVVFADAPSGLVGDENSARPGRAALPSDVAKRIDLTAAHHSVVVMHAPAMVDAWAVELEKSSKAANFVTLSADDPPLAALTDRGQFSFRLKPECPAIHMAEDGQAAGIRWSEAFSKRISAQLIYIREQSPPRPRPLAP